MPALSKKESRFISNLVGILLIIGYILPTSLEEFTLNHQMRLNNFFLLDAIAVFIILYEKLLDKKRIIVSFLTLLLLLIFTILASHIYNEELKPGNLLLYSTCIICCNITFQRIKATPFWDILFLAMMTNILIFGFGTLLQIDYLNGVLKKYYVDHQYFFLSLMLEELKPVTFFVSHSIAAFNYTLFIVLFFIRDLYYKKQLINKIFILGFTICMIFLRSNSSILFLFIIYILYLLFNFKKINIYKILIIILSAAVIIYLIVSNMELVTFILSSRENGIRGRFSEDGTLSDNVKFILDMSVPSGLYDIKYNGHNLLYRDSSYLVNMMRGGILLVFTYTYVVIRFLKKNVKSNAVLRLFLLLVLLFDFGYPVTWEQRFLSGFLFMLPYLNMITSNNQRRISVCRG